MRRLLGVGAVVLGVAGVLACAAAIGLGWWVATRTADRVTRVAARLDDGLGEADERLARVEERLAAIRGDLGEARAAGERLAAENPELPRVRAASEQLLERVVPTIDRAAALAASLRTVAAGLRAAENVVAQLGGPTGPGRAHSAADAIDRGAAALDVPRERIDAVKSAAVVRMTRELATLVREVAAGSERLAEGLSAARRELADARTGTAEWRERIVFWVYAAAAANTLVWLWLGLGQACLIGCGRRLARPGTTLTRSTPAAPPTGPGSDFIEPLPSASDPT